MALACDILSWILLLSGSFFAVVGGIGIVRFPDFFSRIHGAGVTDTLGAGLIILGLVVQAAKDGLTGVLGPWLVAVKLFMILFFLLITSPTSTHALAQAALESESIEVSKRQEDDQK